MPGILDGVRAPRLSKPMGKGLEDSPIPNPETILELDLKALLGKVETKYGLSLPKRVVAVDLGPRRDLYVRFRHVEKPIGEGTAHGLAVFFYDDGESLVAFELLESKPFT